MVVSDVHPSDHVFPTDRINQNVELVRGDQDAWFMHLGLALAVICGVDLVL